MQKNTTPYLTVNEIRERMISGEDIPTAIFLAKKKNYIVKPRGTIFGFKKNKRNIRIK